MAVRTHQIPVPHPRQGRRPGSSRWFALAVLCVSILMVNLDNTVLNVALPTLVRDLHATSSQLQWIVDAYMLVFGGLLLVAGSLADRVGRKRTFLAGLVAFAGGSAWSAFSGSVGVLIAARASMGVGAALMMPSTLAIITDMFRDARQRQLAIGLWAGTSGLGFALGPIVGGLLLARFWWGSVFLINVPIAAVGLLCALPLVPDSKNPAARRPDLAGAVLSIAGLGLVLWSIIEAPVHGWSSALVIGTGIAGLAVLAGFVAWERASSHPMLNLQFFRRPSFSAAVGSNGLALFGLAGALFVLTQFLQFNLGYSALQAGDADAADRGHDSGDRPSVGGRGPRGRDQAHHGGGPAADRRRLVAGLPCLGNLDLYRHAARPDHDRHRRGPGHAGGVRVGHGLRCPAGTPASARRPTACPSRSAAPWASPSSAACCPPATRTR